MKKYIISISLAIATLGLVSCGDYLDRNPKDETTDLNNWTSEASLESYAYMLYENFEGYGSGWARGQYHSSSMSDNYCPDSYSQPTVNVPSSSGNWNGRYTEIRRANILLNRVDVVPNLTDEAANHWRGIARFFRAMKHFELVKTYGDCVWVDTETDINDVEALGKGRDSRVDVMKNVCADLDFAGNNCRHTTDNTVNDMCAWALLSRAALYEAAWQKYHENNTANAQYFYDIAKNAANKVITSGYYAIHNNYRSNYISKDLKGNTEMILYKMYTYTGEGASVSYAHAMQGWSCSSSKTWGLTKSAVESFANSNGLPIYMGTYSDATVQDVFANRDARLSDIAKPDLLCPVGYAYEEGINSSTAYWTNKFVDWNDYGKVTWNAPYNTTDAPVFAYSEVLENYAEACAEIESLGGTAMTQADLDKSVNECRVKHGNLPKFTYVGGGAIAVNGTTITTDPKNTTGISNALWELRRERRSELMCDGYRYNDLMRWKLGKLIDFTKNPDCYKGASKAAIVAFFNATHTQAIYTGNTISGIEDGNFWTSDNYISAFNIAVNNRTFDEVKNYLEPIPSTEINLNPNLTQNPGW